MAAEQTQFIEYVDQEVFAQQTMEIAELYNGEDSRPGYLHKEILNPVESLTGKWESRSVDNSLIMADYVSTNSSLPLKSRDSVSSAGGKIPKVGQHLWLDEEQLDSVLMAISRNRSIEDIRAMLLQDLPRVIVAINERLEDTTLTGLSNGVALMDTDNVGVGLRINYGYKPANQIGSAIAWGTPGALPLDDLDTALKLQPNNRAIFLDKTAIKGLFADDAARAYFGFISGFVGGVANIPNLNQDAVVAVLKDKFGFDDVVIVDRRTVYEIDGVRTTKTPWKDGTIVLAPSRNVGELQWSMLTEAQRPVSGILYGTADSYILTSFYRDQEPFFTEHTKSQAKVIPVINGATKIVTLDTKANATT